MDICWDFNGDLSNPTVSPSILVKHPTGDKWNVCHSFIKDGKIQYLPDCTHDLAGETIDMANVVDI